MLPAQVQIRRIVVSNKRSEISPHRHLQAKRALQAQGPMAMAITILPMQSSLERAECSFSLRGAF